MQFNIIVQPFINVFCMHTETYIMLMIRYVILCPHGRYPQVVQSASCLVHELSSPRVDQSARCPVRELAIRELAYPRVVQ